MLSYPASGLSVRYSRQRETERKVSLVLSYPASGSSVRCSRQRETERKASLELSYPASGLSVRYSRRRETERKVSLEPSYPVSGLSVRCSRQKQRQPRNSWSLLLGPNTRLRLLVSVCRASRIPACPATESTGRDSWNKMVRFRHR